MTSDDYQLTRATYEEHAEELFHLWKDSNLKSTEKIDRFVGLLPPGGRVLDLGAGFGKDMAYLQHRGFDCIGVDSCKAFIRKAARLYPECHIQRVDFLDIDFPADSFDGIWSRGALLHVSKPDFRRLLVELHRILRSGGPFYLQLLEGTGQGVDFVADTGAKAFYAYYKKPEIRGIMAKAGFRFMTEIVIAGWINDYYCCSKS